MKIKYYIVKNQDINNDGLKEGDENIFKDKHKKNY